MSKPSVPSRRFRTCAVVLATALAVMLLAERFLAWYLQSFPWDFAINQTAAWGFRSGLSLYDQAGLRDLGQTTIGPIMARTFTFPFNSYIGLPSTALVYLPFTAWTFPISIMVYRICLVVAFCCAILLLGLTLPESERSRGWWWGGAALILSDGVDASLRLGQVDAWIVLGLAGGLWAISRKRYWLAGIGLGLATALKISPIVLVVYAVLRWNWRVAAGAAIVVILVVGIATATGRPSDLWIFLTTVMPVLSHGALNVENQALPAWIARMADPSADVLSYVPGIGLFRHLSPIMSVGFLAALLWRRRSADPVLLELGVLVFAALLAGPITWENYASWTVVPVVLMAADAGWAGHSPPTRGMLLKVFWAGGVLLVLPGWLAVLLPIDEHPWLAPFTGLKTVGFLLWTGVAIMLLEMYQGRTTAPLASPAPTGPWGSPRQEPDQTPS